jgi:serine protease
MSGTARGTTSAVAIACVVAAVAGPGTAGAAPGDTAGDTAAAGRPPSAADFSGDIAGAPVSRLVVRPAPGVPFAEVRAAVGSLTGGVASGSQLADGFRAIELVSPLTADEAATIAARVVASGVATVAEPDMPRAVLAPPNDPRFGEQWNLTDVYLGSPAEGIGIDAAWAVTTGSPSVVVAVIDTGVLPHPDLAARLTPGYDMISNDFIGRDAEPGRDADPTDTGDWTETADECGFTYDAAPSSWHGTHVSGIVGADTNNGIGMAGVDQRARVQSIRILGRCGGTVIDEADAIRWAAGLAVPGAPLNPTPARVINLSLGGPGPCMAYEQAAIDAAIAAGAIVVVAAGNESDDLDVTPHAPANCNNVITVAATTRVGDRTTYSNYGSNVDIAAPGGDTLVGGAILSTLNTSATAPDLSASGWTYGTYEGTSMAAPHVAGVVSLMLAANPALTPAQVEQMLESTARPFPPSPYGAAWTCSSNPADEIHCGAGILDAGGAVVAASRAGQPPGAPTGVSVEAGVHRAFVSWSPPLPNGTTAIASYTASAEPGGWACTTLELTCTIDNIPSGTYTFSVRATTLAGTGPPSSPVGPITLTAGFRALRPVRLLDTRSGIGAPHARLRPGALLVVDPSLAVGAPPSEIGAVSFNVTATRGLAAGYVSAFPCAAGSTETSSLNFARDSTNPNAVLVPTSGGAVCFTASAPVDLIADVNGWFATGATFTPVVPTRVFDTRNGIGSPRAKITPTAPLAITITGTHGVPATGVAAVSLNVTATRATAPGYVTVYPCNRGIPDASNLNYVTNGTVPNAVVAPVDSNGQICFYASAPVDLIADINGWFATGTGFVPRTPTRVFDTRNGIGSPRAKITPTAPLAITITGTHGVPATGVAAVSLNVTATRATAPGYVTVYPCNRGIPDASNLNYVTNGTVPNAVVAPVDSNGQICFYASAPVDLIADINGYLVS